MATLKLFQFVYDGTTSANLNNVANGIANIIQLGIQAPPGTEVTFGGGSNTDSKITIGNTGIFSLEVNDAIVLQGPLAFTKVPKENLLNMPIIVDIVYIDTNIEGSNA